MTIPSKTVVVVGGGLSGSLLALKLSLARPDFRVCVIESGRRLGRGVAYGACAPEHLLNVPVSRMEVGLKPSFSDWLMSDPGAIDAIGPALAESGGDLQAAFVPRTLFGDYLQACVTAALKPEAGCGLTSIRGEAVRLRAGENLGVRLDDGREIEGDVVVLATGNMPPRAPGGPDGWLYDSPAFVPDPWAPNAFEEIDPQAPLLLLGAGLTAVDVVLKLRGQGHGGPILALSRRGLTPAVHRGGGAWPAFLEDALPASPARLTRLIRQQVALAESRSIPWQRVFDAARPAVPAVWRGWTETQRRQFLRHLRAWWDIHRHRMAPRIADRFEAAVRDGQLTVAAARIRGFARLVRGTETLVETRYALRGGGEQRFVATHIVNCTGPRRDVGQSGIPLLADLRDQGLATPDSMGLGLETDDSALIDSVRRPSRRLYALGALTCPSWWEIVAVPEISVQVDRLVAKLAHEGEIDPGAHPLTPEDFLDLGAGI